MTHSPIVEMADPHKLAIWNDTIKVKNIFSSSLVREHAGTGSSFGLGQQNVDLMSHSGTWTSQC